MKGSTVPPQGDPPETEPTTGTAAKRTSPPPPAEIRYEGRHAKNPLDEVAFGAMCAGLPRVPAKTARMA